MQQQQQQQHMNKKEDDVENEIRSSEGSEKELNLEDKKFIFNYIQHLYAPKSGRNWHLAFVGCLRVTEPFLSPHRYK